MKSTNIIDTSSNFVQEHEKYWEEFDDSQIINCKAIWQRNIALKCMHYVSIYMNIPPVLANIISSYTTASSKSFM